MTTQDRIPWKEMLNFTKGLSLTRPWYRITDTCTQGWSIERISTEFATHELVPGYQFMVKIDKLARPSPFSKRKYHIALEAQEEKLTLKDGKRFYWVSGTRLGGETTTAELLKNYYEHIRAVAGDEGNETGFAVQDVKRILGDSA